MGEKILAALSAIAQAARRTLTDRSAGISGAALINRSNMMVGVGKPEKFIHALNAELRDHLRRLQFEPFIARIEVDWEDDSRPSQTFYLARRSAAGLNDVIDGAHFITSRDELGRLAEYEAGENAYIEVRGRERTARILKRTVLEPRQQPGGWDAVVQSFEATPWGDLLEVLQHESLRQAIEQLRQGSLAVEDILGRISQEAADAQSARQRVRRKVVDRIALRDRPILNKFQGAIFRLPLDRQVILFGPPGSGKTTTLIKRLAQKRTSDALTESERALVNGTARADLVSSWAMFSPGELLRQYLGDAFNKEGIPNSGNVRTWDKERHYLARNVLNILRSASSGRFQLEANPGLLLERTSWSIADLHDEFVEYVDTDLSTRCGEALAQLLVGRDDSSKRLAVRIQDSLGGKEDLGIDDLLGLVDMAGSLQEVSGRVGEQISGELRKTTNLLLNRHKALLNEIAAALPSIRSQDQEEEEDDNDETSQALSEAAKILWSALRNWARAVAEGRRTLGGQSGSVIELIGTRLPPVGDFAGIGANIATRSCMRTLLHAPRSLVLGVPAVYARFRRQMIREGRHFVPDRAATECFSRNMISPDEVDVLLLVMLRNARRVLGYVDGRRDSSIQYDWLETIRSRYLSQVFVDEATDLSSVQLACTIELADPELRSWFACGDLRQRVTATGIRDESEIEWLNRNCGVRIDICRIDIGYRQSQRLRDLADALAPLLDEGAETETKAPPGSEEADVWPLLSENLSGDDLGRWLAGRIREVEKAVGWLPSIAVFVDGDELIDPLLGSTKAALAEWNIPIVGCREGRIVGDANDVRVFDIQHIKGLEFEAVVFIGAAINLQHIRRRRRSNPDVARRAGCGARQACGEDRAADIERVADRGGGRLLPKADDDVTIAGSNGGARTGA